MNLIETKNVTAIIYYLNNQGKERGYNRDLLANKEAFFVTTTE